MATLGKTAIGASNGPISFGTLGGSIFLASSNGTINDIQVYVAGGSGGSQTIRPVVYNASSATVPTTLVAVGTEATVAGGQAAGWVTLTISAAIVSGQFYALGIWGSSVGSTSRAQAHFDTVANAGDGSAAVTYSSLGSPTSPWPTPSLNTSAWSVFADYTPSAPTVTQDMLTAQVLDLLTLRRC